MAVIGLGYVGVPLAISAAEAGFNVTGIDLDDSRIASINQGLSYLEDVEPEQIARNVLSGTLSATTDPRGAEKAEIVVLCVPTPLKNELPDMSYIESSASSLADILQPGRLVVLESTTYPGTTEHLLRDALERSGLKAGEDFLLGFSPERIDPGNSRFGIENVPKIIGGLDEASSVAMEAFYGSFVKKVVRVSSPGAAEMAKLLENTYRHVNIALINEIAILCHDLGLDVWEVIDAAATKPFGFQPFYPGPGWGGHCIPVDPAYLSWRVRQLGETARFVELAREINERMPGYVVERIAECLNDEGKSLRGSTVLVLGVTYKAGVADLRESPALEIVERLSKKGAKVRFNDPYVTAMDHADYTEFDENSVSSADITVIVTDHATYNWSLVAEHAKLVLDTRNALKGLAGQIIRL